MGRFSLRFFKKLTTRVVQIIDGLSWLINNISKWFPSWNINAIEKYNSTILFLIELSHDQRINLQLEILEYTQNYGVMCDWKGKKRE